ncbi:hypothetical protein T484DRAFT_1794903 [Baffinella frigidus]|nr:hypothetical protein T484DRAFT_1794903 [Cryptophyta sp. CCMP2293]
MKLFYISTDYVFGGDGGGMMKPGDAVNPQGVYALSKLGGECSTRLCPGAVVVRLSFSQAFNDQWTSRLSVSDAAAQFE